MSGSDRPGAVDHLVPELRGARTLRWVVAVLGIYNTYVALESGSWGRLALWGLLTAWLLAVQVRPWRVGTRVEPEGVRRLVGWSTRRLVPWSDVARLHVQGPYERSSTLFVVGGGALPLHGMAPDAVRAVAAERGLVLDDPTRRRQDAAAGLTTPQHPASAPTAEDPLAPVAPVAPVGPAPDLPAEGAAEDLPDDPMDGPFRSSRR